MQAILRQQAAAIRESTKADDAAARAIAQSSSPAGGPRKLSPDMTDDFKRASDDQVAKLGREQEDNENQVVQKLDEMSQMQELMKDFNLFEALYHDQEDLTQQAQAYNRAGQMSREDQLALKDLAAAEKQVADALGQLQGKLRDDAGAAEKQFPKAAQSGRDLADKIEAQRMAPLADQATGTMLAGAGDQSFELAEQLRGRMEKLFSECQGGNCPSGGELDSYLTLQHLNPGNNFAQMGRSRKFGLGKGLGQGNGQGTGMGEGMMGSSGYAVTNGSSLEVLGNESSVRNGNAAARQSSRFGKGAGALAAGGRGQAEKPDVVNGLNPVNRQSGADSTESVIEEYNDVVESYFKTITTKNPVHAPSN